MCICIYVYIYICIYIYMYTTIYVYIHVKYIQTHNHHKLEVWWSHPSLEVHSKPREKDCRGSSVTSSVLVKAREDKLQRLPQGRAGRSFQQATFQLPQGNRYIYIHTYMHVCMYVCIYIYIYNISITNNVIRVWLKMGYNDQWGFILVIWSSRQNCQFHWEKWWLTSGFCGSCFWGVSAHVATLMFS